MYIYIDYKKLGVWFTDSAQEKATGGGNVRVKETRETHFLV